MAGQEPQTANLQRATREAARNEPETNQTRKFPDDDESCVSSRDLAEMLETAYEEFCRLIEENRKEVLKFGPIIQTPIKPEGEK